MFAGMVLRRKTELYSVELREMSEASGVTIQGLLGMSDLKRFVIQIDFDLGKLRILRSANEDCGDKFRLGSDHDCPTVKLSIGETIIDAIVDTGLGNDLLLSNDVFDRLVEHGQIALAADTVAATFVGDRKLSKGTLRKTSLGSFEYKGARVAKTQSNAIGSTYLSHFLVTLDFPKQAMYLKPGKNYDRPAYHDASGIGMRLRAKAVVVEEVRSESPGDIGGIQKSDVLRQINDRDASSLSLFEIRRLFCQDGKTLKLRFERDGKPRDVTITLRKYD